ncbi:MAG: EthD family reductase [Vicinamibacterales bacterium]
MITVLVLYPKVENATFDMEYYRTRHLPLFASLLGDACLSWGGARVTTGDWLAMGWAVITSQDAFDAAMAEHGETIRADVPNFTDLELHRVIGEITALSSTPG